MEISISIQRIWDILLQNTPNQDPRLLTLALSFFVAALLGTVLIIAWTKKPKRTSSATKTKTQQSKSSNNDVESIKELSHNSWLAKLQNGLAKTRGSLNDGISKLFGSSSLDDELLEELHERLFRADLGIETADGIVEHLKAKFNKETVPNWDDVRTVLNEKVLEILSEPKQEIQQASSGPQVILIVGVNGVGKTTSVGKLAAHLTAQGKKVLLCAADTYRAAAIDQLQVWGDRIGCDIIKHQQGADPASVAYDGVKAAISRGVDVLLIDTAGRLHNKSELMDELGKIKRVIGKDLPEAPHETWIVVDATTGQNAFQQVEAFSQVTPLSGIVVTKLDGTAKGGVVIGVTDKFKLPIRYIGVGEQASDLREFKAQDFADSLF